MAPSTPQPSCRQTAMDLEAADDLAAKFLKLQLANLATPDDICSICMEPISTEGDLDADHRSVALHEGHAYGRSCIMTWLQENASCPLCRKAIFDIPSDLRVPFGTASAPSSPTSPTSPISAIQCPHTREWGLFVRGIALIGLGDFSDEPPLVTSSHSDLVRPQLLGWTDDQQHLGLVRRFVQLSHGTLEQWTAEQSLTVRAELYRNGELLNGPPDDLWQPWQASSFEPLEDLAEEVANFEHQNKDDDFRLDADGLMRDLWAWLMHHMSEALATPCRYSVVLHPLIGDVWTCVTEVLNQYDEEHVSVAWLEKRLTTTLDHSTWVKTVSPARGDTRYDVFLSTLVHVVIGRFVMAGHDRMDDGAS